MRVPLSRIPSAGGSTAIGDMTCPRANPILCTCPPRTTSTSIRSLSALTTETPTPCRPLETL